MNKNRKKLDLREEYYVRRASFPLLDPFRTLSFLILIRILTPLVIVGSSCSDYKIWG